MARVLGITCGPITLVQEHSCRAVSLLVVLVSRSITGNLPSTYDVALTNSKKGLRITILPCSVGGCIPAVVHLCEFYAKSPFVGLGCCILEILITGYSVLSALELRGIEDDLHKHSA